jgi:hypothetical protein
VQSSCPSAAFFKANIITLHSNIVTSRVRFKGGNPKLPQSLHKTGIEFIDFTQAFASLK